MKISITRGLAELKILNERITNAISTGVYVGAVRGDAQLPINVPKSVGKLTEDIKASYQTVNDLIKRREAIKRAIIVSNGLTQVTIGKEVMTVAEAIERKSSIAYLKTFYVHLRAQHQAASNIVNVQNAKMDADIEKRIAVVYGADKTKISADQTDMIGAAVKKDQAASLLDPSGIEGQMATVKKSYEDFETEVDFVLSESNARTEVEVA